MTDREILKEIVEIQKSLVEIMINQLNISLKEQDTFYSPIKTRINELLEKLTEGE